MVRPLRLKWGVLWLCTTEMFASLCATQKKDFAKLRGLKMYVVIIATQNGYIATLRDRNVCVTFPDPKKTVCKYVRPKKGMVR